MPSMIRCLEAEYRHLRRHTLKNLQNYVLDRYCDIGIADKTVTRHW